MDLEDAKAEDPTGCRGILRREAAQRQAREQVATLLDALDTRAIFYTLHYPEAVARLDPPGADLPPSFAHLDWTATPALEMAIDEDATRDAMLLHTLAERADPADPVMVTLANGDAPQVELARADLDCSLCGILTRDAPELWLSSPSASWMIAVRRPWIRVAG